MTLRQEIWHFTDVSKSKASGIYHILIGIIIASSSMLAFWELVIPQALDGYHEQVMHFERVVLAIFTAEFLIRILCTPSLKKFSTDKFNWIDFMAIAPFYMNIESAMILRVLRILRLAKLWKTFASAHLFEMIKLKGGILEKVTPFVLLLLFFKYLVITLEYAGVWIKEVDLNILFTIIGFSLGIILSKKIGISYGKFRELEDSFSRLHGKMSAVVFYMNKMKKGTGTEAAVEWIRNFLSIYNGEAEGSVRKVVQNNDDLYDKLAKIGNTELIPHHRMAAIADGLFSESVFILSWKSNYTPQAFDRLLLQIIVMYLLMVIAFIPGLAGVISTLVASYLLYGMYYVTREMDFATGEEQEKLIRLEPMRLQNYLQMLEEELAQKPKKKVARKKPVKKIAKDKT